MGYGFIFMILRQLFICPDIIMSVSIGWILNVHFKSHFVYPSGKPMAPHLQRCQGFAVGNYSVTLGRLEDEAPSTFAQLGFYYAH